MRNPFFFQLVHNGDKYLECDLCEAVIVKDNFDEHKKVNLCQRFFIGPYNITAKTYTYL